MKTITLNGKWNLYFNLEFGNMHSTIDEVKEQKWPRIDAVVPGNVELDLVRAGIEEDPFYSQNLYNFRKYEFYQWWFEKEFKVPEDYRGKDVFLLLKGLNTFGSIWINGEIAGQVSNMLIEHELDITNLIKIGDKNHIAIRIESPINKVRDKDCGERYQCRQYRRDGLARMPLTPSDGILLKTFVSWYMAGYRNCSKENLHKRSVLRNEGFERKQAELVVKIRLKTKTHVGLFSKDYRKCEDSIIEGSYKTKFCSDERFWWYQILNCGGQRVW